jgi:PKD repeat protein
VSDVRRPPLTLLLGCLLLVAGVSAIDGYSYYQTIEYAACDQETYQQDIVIHRSTGTAYNETAGGLETWHIYVGDHCREDYGDIRFTNSTGAELAYYLWPDYSSESARFAVRLEGADGPGTLTVWYGNSAAETTSDGDLTYTFFDDFSASIEWGTKWASTSQGSYSTADGKLITAFPASAANQINTFTSFSNAICECSLRNPNPTKQMYMNLEDAKGVYRDKDQFVLNFNTGKIELKLNGGGSSASVTKYSDEYYRYRYICPSSGTAYQYTYYPDGTLAHTHSGTPAYRTFYPSFLRWDSGYGYIDWIIVRTYSATPPAALTFSGEQSTATPPATAFTATPTAGLAPLTVQFTDLSAGTPTVWSWTFGDGNTSTAQNPQHTYAAPGLYTVTLNATNEYGSDEETRTDYITVYAPVTAQFSANITGGTAPLTVQFTDLSTGGPTSWSWSFGDGNTSTAQNPQHTYTTAGTHTVTLTASHPYSSDTETKTSYITVAVLQPFPGLPLIPRDLTGNGLYTDINGNNRLDYNDLTVFFQHLAWAKTAQPIACFDFNGNGWLDYNDVITLFVTITGEHP